MSNLHLLSGRFRGRPLKSPKGNKTRPTTALLRKSVFDSLRPCMEEALFLDLFAGSGAMGLEALSGGAAHATFVDESREAIRCIEENISLLHVQNETTVIQGDVLKILKRLTTSFDIIYSDPPYEKAALQCEILTVLDQSPLLKPGCWVLLEEGYPSQLQLKEVSLQHLVYRDSRNFGKSLLHRFQANS